MNDSPYKEMLKAMAKEQDSREIEYKDNPLARYSTSQLKAELRRRKNE